MIHFALCGITEAGTNNVEYDYHYVELRSEYTLCLLV